MSDQREKDIALIGRFCAATRSALTSAPRANEWEACIGGYNLLSAIGRDHDEAVHLLAPKIMSRIAMKNQEAVEKAAKTLSDNAAILGDWSEK